MCILRPLLSCQPHIEVGFIDIFSSLVKIYTRDNFEKYSLRRNVDECVDIEEFIIKVFLFSSD